VDCAVHRAADNLTQLHYKEGPNVIRWRRRLVRAVTEIAPPPELAPEHPIPHTRELADA